MKKVTIIYWSGTGHVEKMAEHIGKGAENNGAIIKIMKVSEAKVNDVLDADAVAFGSPSVDKNNIEQKEMQPFIGQFKQIAVEQKKAILFGSYGWDNGEFMGKWLKMMKDYDFDVLEHFVIKEAPSNEQLRKCEDLGAMLAK